MSYARLTTEADRMENEAAGLRAAIVSLEVRLGKAKTRTSALKNLVSRQFAHLETLTKGQETVSFGAYKDMRLKHNQHRRHLKEAKSMLEDIEKELKAKRLHLTHLEAGVRARRAELSTWGEVLPLRKA